ncbi:MAG TPA: peptidylprolyl isomerase, partial [Pyrinomonadaceae bacterium]|nr:peptidylprolyl isomerase [Pyrinomonadaceae bacterium]
RVQGGYIGKVFRGSIAPSIEVKLFNAEIGEPLGPFTTQDELVYEIYQVSARHPAKLDDAIKSKIAKIIYNEWLQNCAREHILEVM